MHCNKQFALLGFFPHKIETVNNTSLALLSGLPPVGGSVVKNPPAMQEPQEKQVLSLGGNDPLEEDMAILSSILPLRAPWTEPGGLQSIGSPRVGRD